MTTPAGNGRDAVRHCPECGVELRAGIKYCDFCGRKVAVETLPPPPRRRVGGRLLGVAFACLAVGVLVYAGRRHAQREPTPVSLSGSLDAKYQAAAICESAIRKQARAPFRVIAFRSSLVAEERAGHVVTGTVELQSATGELQRKRYLCRTHRDAAAGMILDEGKLY